MHKDRCEEDLSEIRDYSIMIPAGTWHNIKNIGNIPLKLHSVYAPPQHPFVTVHKTKADSDKAEQKSKRTCRAINFASPFL